MRSASPCGFLSHEIVVENFCSSVKMWSVFMWWVFIFVIISGQ